MKTNLYASGKKTLHVLDDLIRINIDRVAGFEKASHEEATPEPQLREAFYRMAVEARSFVNDLHACVIRLGGAPVTQATITGKIYLSWLEGKNRFDGPDDASRLAACRMAGAATEQAYHHALDENLPEELQRLLENQLWALERDHKGMRELEDNFNLKF
jgi:uncharacterized protein (TIGR02284 family)